MGCTIGSEAACNNRLVGAIGLGARACSTANAWHVDWNHITELLSVTSNLPWWSATLLKSCDLSCQLHDLFVELNKLTTVILMVDSWGLRTYVLLRSIWSNANKKVLAALSFVRSSLSYLGT